MSWFKITILLCLLILLLSHIVESYEYEIAIIKTKSNKAYDEAVAGFMSQMRSIGYINGQNIQSIEYDLDKAKNNEQEIIRRIRETPSSLILAVGTSATKFAVRNFTRIPVVYVMVLDNSQIKEGNNITGVVMQISGEDRIKKISEALPSIQNIGIIHSDKYPLGLLQEIAEACTKRHIALIEEKVQSETEVSEALMNIYTKIDALLLIPDANVGNIRTASGKETQRFINKFTLQHKIPLIGFTPEHIKNGALLAITVNFKDMGAQAADIAKQILDGQSVQQIAIQQARPFLYINAKIATFLKIEIPHEVKSIARILE